MTMLRDNMENSGLPAILAAMEANDPAFLEAISILDQKGEEAERTQDSLEKALRTVFSWFDKNQDLYDKIKDSAIASSRWYLTSMAMLQAMVVWTDLKAWGELVPEANSESKQFQAWQSDPGHTRKASSAIAKLTLERVEEEKQYGKGKKGNSVAQTFGRVSTKGSTEDAEGSVAGDTSKKKKKAKDDSGSSSSEDIKKKTKGKKKDKKDKKDGKKKKKKRSSSSSQSSSEDASAKRKRQLKLASDAAKKAEEAEKKRKGETDAEPVEKPPGREGEEAEADKDEDDK